MDNADIEDLFSGLGAVDIRRMFGGKGIYYQGLIIALEADGALLLKADETTAPRFREAGCSQWTYDSKGRAVAMPYWSIPDEALDDLDEMAGWARLAYEASMRTSDKGRRSVKRGRGSS